MTFGMEKTKTMWLPNGEKFENMFIPFDRMYERDTHTHTHTDTHRMMAQAMLA